MKSIRCAIYTRKSTEEGLEQNFNSLDVQYAACSAYVASQASEGWTLIKTRYDDGGISGGTLERPGLKALLSDIAAGKVDIVVVYKVDRLTRSLLDFSQLVEAFDGAGVDLLGASTADPKHMASIVSRSAALLAKLDGKRGLPVQVLLARIIRRVAVQEDAVELTFEPSALGKELGLPVDAVTSNEMRIIIPARIRRSGLAVRFMLQTGQAAVPGTIDRNLLVGIAKGRARWERLKADTSLTVTGLAAAEGADPSYVDHMVRLTFLAPSIVDAALEGTAPADLNLNRLKNLKRIALSWSDQRRLMGFAAARG